MIRVLALGIIFSTAVLLSGCTQTSPSPTQVSTTGNNYVFETPKKSAHYESNTPEHGAVLAGVPINVVIDFNFDLAKPSSILITSASQEYGDGETIIDSGKLAMRRNIKGDAPDGLYTVTYNACWPDGSCHDGKFQFRIERKTSEHIDLTKMGEEIVNITQLGFSPQKIRVSAGTKVTWVNNDDTVHYINTDSHPAHTYFPKQNSQALAKGDSYSVTFEKPGIYPYHCSAHATTMTGEILVQ